MIVVDGHEFKSVSALTRFTRELIATILGPSKSKRVPSDHHSFFIELFKRHYVWSSKISEVDYFVVGYSIFKNKAIFIMDSSGRRDEVSYIKACSGREANVLQDLNIAFRNAVAEDILSFRASNDGSCAFCGGLEALEVDHIYEFKNIVRDFLKFEPDHPTSFNKETPYSRIFNEEDKEYVAKFVAFHRSFADNLRYLCHRCHVGRRSSHF